MTNNANAFPIRQQVEDDNAAVLPASTEQTKRCPSCGRELPLSAFHKHAKSRDGHMAECKECTKRRLSFAKGNTSINPLAKFTARELMRELDRRGYKGELTYTEIKVHKIKLSEM